MNGQEAYNQGKTLMLDSKLVYLTDNGFMTYSNIDSISEDEQGNKTYGYKTLEDKVWFYYTDFLVNDERCEFTAVTEKTEDNMATWVLQYLYGISSTENTSDYYEAATVEGVSSYTSRPVLKASVQEKVDNEDTAVLSSLLKYYSSSDGTGIYLKAYSNLSTQPYFVKVQNTLDEIQYIAYAPFAGAGVIIFFVIIPLCTKDGKTIGKLALGLSVIDKDRKKAKKWQILIHYLVIVCWWTIILTVHSYIWMVFGIFLSIIDYMVRIINRNGQSLHDILAQTIVITSRGTEWERFNYKGGEEIMNKELDSKNNPSNQSWEDKYVKKSISKSDDKEDTSDVEEDTGVLNMDIINKRRDDIKKVTSFDDYVNESKSAKDKEDKK